jgi:hypothetical protein
MVASQALVRGRNWQATVAAIDYVFDDGQMEYVSEFLACDAAVRGRVFPSRSPNSLG